jgi:hypothetical protein
MAVVVASQVQVLFNNTSDAALGERVVLFRIRNVTTADTFDVAAWFARVKAATFLPSGILTTTGVGTPAGTVLTLTLASVANDPIYLLVTGPAANAS